MTRRPNVILLFSDDHGYADRGACGTPGVSTPALDRLAAEGATCTQAYVTAPICSPSRAGLIAGQYQQRWGARWFDSSRFPPEDRPSLAEGLRAQGYRTGYLGKVHYGREDIGDRACPPHHGFDETYYGLAGKQMGRLNYLRHSRAAVAEYGPEASSPMAVQPMLEGDDQVDLEAFLTDELGRRAREFVADSAEPEDPFFLMVAFNAVHNFCFQLPDDELNRRGLAKYGDWDPETSTYLDWYDGAISPNLPDGRRYYLAQLELMDRQIGLLLDSLEQLGIADDTLILYTTDNGGSTCNFGVNEPLRGTKYTVYEGGIRVPFLARWRSGGIRPGTTYDGLVSTMDLFPTFLAAAGAPASAYEHSDGIDQLPGLRGSDASSGHTALHWDTGFQWAVREGDWKLAYIEDGKHIEYLRKVEHVEVEAGWHLTDLASDLGETVNLVDVRPDIVEGLRSRHEEWQAAVS